ncbi:tetratricopeptide repeat protein [Opitutus terrae]|uniref:protein O-GlcNAc transferase n=1 Tax=Opitutus terrae (strain DSM 11246 / JCM 15787 / PB90-1) TaxID=452637 RepID=B1ZZP6_OPITP|nr:tetratricopeptide repeat protein [Opitutus terrae]ACB77232.1 Tetratricopeptide TPR_2 repeat protein [Opitutus terrae PB90-1]
MTAFPTPDATGPLTIAQAFAHALAHHQAGRLKDAERLYRSILGVAPRHADTNHNLGMIALQANQRPAAVQFFRAALEAEPHHAQYWFSYIAALIHADEIDGARSAFKQAEDRGIAGPQMAELSARLSAAGSKPERPDARDVQALLNHFGAGHFEEAAMAGRSMTAKYPQYALGWKVLGPALMKLGQTAEALDAMQTAIALSPSDPHVHHNLSTALKSLGRLEEAAASARRALGLGVDAHLNLASIEYQSGRYDEAIACCRRALELKQDSVEGHVKLANVLVRTGQLDEATGHYRRALEIEPNLPAVHRALGTILQDQARYDEAAAHFRRACDLRATDLSCQISLHLALPAIAQSGEAIDQSRTRFRSALKTLARSSATLDDHDGPPVVASFYLAYHGQDDRDLMELIGELYRDRWPELSFVSPHVAGWHSPTGTGRKIRVGFLSAFLTGHTIGKLYQGFLRHLDRQRFEVYLIRAPESKRDGVGAQLGAYCDKVISLAGPLRTQQQRLADQELDVLFYPDIGMAPYPYCLAHARLAPVQAVSWGHPVTTGLRTIDYFVSAQPIEPQGAAAHYSETLIRLERLPCFYEPFVVPSAIPSRSDLDLPATGTLYGCPQSLFKFHPDFDAILVAIVTGDPESHLVLLEGAVPIWKEQLRTRWARTAPLLLNRTIFLPRLELDRFMGMIANMDVLLDPVHFGSGNTLYEAMAFGVPIVTWAGQFMRGRVVAGAYRQMGISDAPVAERLEDYANLAVTLGRDPERRARLRRELIAAAQRDLFADAHAVREFETFLTAAVSAADEQRKLSSDWRYDAAS